MLQLTRDRTHEIITDPRFRNLTSARAKLRWSLSIVTLIMFFGFITLISTAKNALGVAVAGSSISLGLLLAMSMIVAVVILTGFYVYRSNSRFDELARVLNREFGQCAHCLSRAGVVSAGRAGCGASAAWPAAAGRSR